MVQPRILLKGFTFPELDLMEKIKSLKVLLKSKLMVKERQMGAVLKHKLMARDPETLSILL